MKTLIIDDERLARGELKRLLGDHKEIEIIGEARNGVEGLAMIKRLQPDLLFLDIQMPGKNGFEVLDELEETPRVIFTTAYDRFAIRAFEVNALDYLLKPIGEERLKQALARALDQDGSERPDEQAPLGAEDRVFVKDGARCWFVTLGDVSLFESEGNYTRLYFADQRPLVYRSLAYLEERLDGESFFRAGRKHILNLGHICDMETGAHGGLLAHLPSGLKVELSRRQAQKFKERMSL